MTSLLALLSLLAVAEPSAPAADAPVALGCPSDDVACLRRAYAAAGGAGMPADCTEADRVVAPAEGRSVKDGPAPAAAVPCVATGPESAALPWWGIALAQWGVTLALDLVPAVLFGVTALVAVLPGSTVPTLALLGLALGSIPGLPVVQAVTTNLVGDLMGRGQHRGRLLVQVAVSAALLGVQVVLGAVALIGVGVLVNILWVQLAAPEGRFIPSQCSDVEAQSGRCFAQLQRVSAAGTIPLLVAAGGTLAVVAGNLLIAVGLKGPLLALAFWLHATHPWPAPWPRILPRLAAAPAAAPAEQQVALAPTRRQRG